MTHKTIETPRHTLLVVDDEKTLRFTLTEALEDEGYAAFSAANGEAFALLREQGIDVVLLDLRLQESGEDGITLLKHIKRDYPEVEVIMMTAYGKFDHAVEATKAGCFQFVGKPFQLDQIKLVVKGRSRTPACVARSRCSSGSAAPGSRTTRSSATARESSGSWKR